MSSCKSGIVTLNDAKTLWSTSSEFIDDTHVVHVTAKNGRTMTITTSSLYCNKFSNGTPYCDSGEVRTIGKGAPFVTDPKFVGQPWSSDPKGKNWDSGTNRPVLSWLDFIPTNRIDWEIVSIPPDKCPDKWKPYLLKTDDKGYFVMNLPYYKDASGKKVDIGISGRGNLGRFGCNGAADPVVSRWSYVLAKDGSLQIETDVDGNPILQIVLITRKDNGQLAIPGGMNVDPDGKIVDISMTLANEFLEEVSSYSESDEEKTELQRQKRDELYKIVEELGIEVFRGRNGDPRNTTHAWMVTVCKSIHDPSPFGFFGTFEKRAGSDASAVTVVKWSPLLSKELYANHADMVNVCYSVQRFLLENNSTESVA
jgi:hypothetical protein